MSSSLSPEDVLACRALTKQHGTSYYLASLFFPADVRDATFVLYAFFRIPDEYVDRPEGTLDQARAQLRAYRARWKDALVHGSDDPVLRAVSVVWKTYGLAEADGDCFLDAMEQDLTIDRYETYEDLRGYMDGSAMAVGRLMTGIIGGEEGALPYANALGEAMQLTNFLRDIGEDWRDRSRVYLPQEDLRAFGVSDDDIAQGRVTDAFVALMQMEIRRARAVFAYADEGIPLLSKRGRFAVRAARVLYAGILDEIERQGYDVFTKRARVSAWRKCWLLLSLCAS